MITVFTLNLAEETTEDVFVRSRAEVVNPVPLDFDASVFPGGEPNFRITTKVSGDDLKSKVIVQACVTEMAAMIELLMANDALRRMGFSDIELFIPYFPAARQDRVCNLGEALTVKVYAKLINDCGFHKVYIDTPHSDVTPALIDNVVDLDQGPAQLIRLISLAKTARPEDFEMNEVNIVCPDAGAGKRVMKLCKALTKSGEVSVNMIRCEKVRDVETGALTDFFVNADDLGGLPTYICDDLVAYGGTFKGLGEVLRERNCGPLSLFVAHADCVDGLRAMCDFFDRVYTTASRKSWKRFVDARNLHVFRNLLDL